MSDFNLLPQIAQVIGNIPDKLVTQVATEIMDLAVVNCPERTGFLASSIYIKSRIKNTYGQGMIEPPGDSYALPEIEDPGSGEAWVAVAADYGIFVEFGTRRMGAEPYLIPAVEEVRIPFENGTMLADLLAGEIGRLH